jgi:N-sulfoglucosamine sulfohydrolase
VDGFIKPMSDQDEGLRWWAVVGLHLLDQNAAPASAVLTKALEDESHEVRMMAAWTLVNIGKPEQALACLDDLLVNGTNNETMLHNVLDWMGKPALPLVKEFVTKGGTRKGRYGIGILGRIAELNGW